jgi:hypothetical protein
MKNNEFRNLVFRNVNTYSILYEIAEASYKQAFELEYGSFQNLLISMLFCALTLEGFFNHIGSKFDSEWELKEKKLTRKKSNELVFSFIDYEVDKKQKPFCYLSTIFDFRDQIVHPKTTNFKIENARMDKKNDNPILPSAKWEKMVCHKNAKNFLDNTKEIIRILHEHSDLPGSPFGPPWTASWVIDRGKIEKKE